MRILIASIVDPTTDKGGAGTVTRGFEALIEYCYPGATVITVAPNPVCWRRVRQAFCVAGALVTGMPSKVRFHHQRVFASKVEHLLRHERFDLLVINGTDLAWCLDHAPADIPKLLVVHNTESQIYRGQLASLRFPWRALASVLNADVERLVRYEMEGLRRGSAAIFLSEADAASAVRNLPSLQLMVLHPVFREAPLRIAKRASRFLELGFLGNLEWWPNRDGLYWFLNEILPSLPPDVRLNLFGGGTRRFGARHQRVEAFGFVNDLSVAWETCDWMIVPIRCGSGVAVKAAECIYNGMPILTTSFGLRGLPGVDHPQVIRLESASDWIRFLSSPSARELCKERLPLSCSETYRLESNAMRFVNFLTRMDDSFCPPEGSHLRKLANRLHG